MKVSEENKENQLKCEKLCRNDGKKSKEDKISEEFKTV